MTSLLDLQLWAQLLTALMLGGMMFFAFVFAPLVFTKLPGKTAGGFIREVFPVYYITFAAVALLAAALAAPSIDALVLVVVALFFLLARYWLMPKINEARDRGEGRTFNGLHRLSVIINAAQMIAVFVVFVRLGF
ncbi:MAG: DUF4149 domain-containing protein [Alphaproteobacteria bacterium]|nr:DUF4149 domain-containing protein [Alphaproteobacteria bacterium]